MILSTKWTDTIGIFQKNVAIIQMKDIRHVLLD